VAAQRYLNQNSAPRQWLLNPGFNHGKLTSNENISLAILG
jgi:hypothetical protein